MYKTSRYAWANHINSKQLLCQKARIKLTNKQRIIDQLCVQTRSWTKSQAGKLHRVYSYYNQPTANQNRHATDQSVSHTKLQAVNRPSKQVSTQARTSHCKVQAANWLSEQASKQAHKHASVNARLKQPTGQASK